MMTTDLDLPFISDIVWVTYFCKFFSIKFVTSPLSSSVHTPKLNTAFYLFCNLKGVLRMWRWKG